MRNSTKKYQLYDAHEKSVSNMTEKRNKMLNKRPNNLSQEIKTNSDSIKQLKGNTRDFVENLTVNQDLVLNIVLKQFKPIPKISAELTINQF